jgi:ADP-ribose pyrophosphatase YjhB (NUDIX family)
MTGQNASVVIWDSNGRVLLIHEAYGARRFGPPGGQVEPGETPEEAAIREAREEINCDVELGELIFQGDFVAKDGTPFHGFFFAATIVGGPPTPGDPGEIQSIGWYDLHDLPQPQTISGGHLLSGLADGSIPCSPTRS